MTDFQIFLGCVSGTAKNEEIFNFFSSFGPILEVNLRIRKSDGKCAGFGYLKCQNKQTYEKILKQKKVKYRGRNIVVTQFLAHNDMANNRDSLKKRKVLVKNIPKGITEEEYIKFFEKFGKVEIGYIVNLNKPDSTQKLHGFVIYSDEEAARKVVDQQPITLRGQLVNLKFQKKKKNKVKPASSKSDNDEKKSDHFLVNKIRGRNPLENLRTCSDINQSEPQVLPYERKAWLNSAQGYQNNNASLNLNQRAVNNWMGFAHPYHPQQNAYKFFGHNQGQNLTASGRRFSNNQATKNQWYQTQSPKLFGETNYQNSQPFFFDDNQRNTNCQNQKSFGQNNQIQNFKKILTQTLTNKFKQNQHLDLRFATNQEMFEKKISPEFFNEFNQKNSLSEVTALSLSGGINHSYSNIRLNF